MGEGPVSDFTLHIVRDDLLILSLGERVPPDVCKRIDTELRERLPINVRCLVFWQTSVIDHRPAPPEVLLAADIVEDWMTEQLK